MLRVGSRERHGDTRQGRRVPRSQASSAPRWEALVAVAKAVGRRLEPLLRRAGRSAAAPRIGGRGRLGTVPMGRSRPLASPPKGGVPTGAL